MRILTNKHNLPQTLVDAVKYDTHRNAGTISCTELIDSPKIRILKKSNTYETDVSEQIYALMGTALHHILERANISSVRKRAFILTAETIIMEAEKMETVDPSKASKLKAAANYIFSLIPVFFPEIGEKYIFEKTLRIDLAGGHVLSMTFDLYEIATGILYDYKFCSVYQYVFPESRKKWNQQTNVYAYGLHVHGHPINGIRIVAFFRDWDAHSMMRNRDYPKHQIIEISVPLGNSQRPEPWYDQVEDFINKRIKLHIEAENGNIPDCTGEDRWAKADIFAVKTKGSKKALRLFTTRPAAEAYISENAHQYEKMFIEFRPGGSVRCERFCPVKDFCDQRKQEMEKAANNAKM